MSDPLSLLASACCSTPAHPPNSAAATTAGPSSSRPVDHYELIPAGSTSSPSRSKAHHDSIAHMSVRLPSCASLVAPVNAAATRETSSRHGPSPSATPFQDEQQWHSPTLRAGLHLDAGLYANDASNASLARYALCSQNGTSPNLGGGGQPSYSAPRPAVDIPAPRSDSQRSDYGAYSVPTSPRARRRTNPSPPVELAALPYRAPPPPHAVNATAVSKPGDNMPAWPIRPVESTRIPSAGVVAADFARSRDQTSLATAAVDSIPRPVRDPGRSSLPVYPGSNYDFLDSRRDTAPPRSQYVSIPKAEADCGQAEAEAEFAAGAGSSQSMTSVSAVNYTHSDTTCKVEPTTPSTTAADELADESGTASGSQGEGSVADRPPCAKPKKELKGSSESLCDHSRSCLVRPC